MQISKALVFLSPVLFALAQASTANADIIQGVASGIITTDGDLFPDPLDPVAGQRLYLRYQFDTGPFDRDEFDNESSSAGVFRARNSLQHFELWIGGDSTNVSNDSLRAVDTSLTGTLVQDSPDGALFPSEALEVAYVAGFGTPATSDVIVTRGFFSTIDYESSGEFDFVSSFQFNTSQNLFQSTFFPDAHSVIAGGLSDPDFTLFFGTGSSVNAIEVDQFTVTNLTAASVPEPSSVAFIAAICSFGCYRCRRSKSV